MVAAFYMHYIVEVSALVPGYVFEPSQGGGCHDLRGLHGESNGGLASPQQKQWHTD